MYASILSYIIATTPVSITDGMIICLHRIISRKKACGEIVIVHYFDFDFTNAVTPDAYFIAEIERRKPERMMISLLFINEVAARMPNAV